MVAGFGSPRGRPAWPGAPKPRAVKVAMIPAPVGGINAVSPMASTDPSFCLLATNLVASGQGMRVRPGYSAYTSAAVDADGIRTIIPFEGSSEQALFAVSQNGIYDVSAGGAGPFSPEVSFGTVTDPAGWGTWTNFVSDAGPHYAFYADEENGLYRREEAGTWAAVTDITGVTETDLVFVTQHMERMWFVEDGTASGWYLAVGAISGAATEFNFGNKFNHGGTLVGLYSWTVDGGEGVDDHLVAIGSAGDVLIYKGTDPDTAADWALVGQYYVGALPEGRRVAHNEGGDLYILSQYGVIPLTRLLQGTLVQQDASQLSRNISPLIADAMALTLSERGWEMRNVPSQNVFIVNRPPITGFENLQFCLSTRTQGWTTWESLPYQTGDVWQGTFYFADSDGIVYILDGNTDDGDAIAFSLLTSYQEYEEVGMYHRIQFMRPVFVADGPPSYALDARYDYSTEPPVAAAGSPAVEGALWDAAVWDADYWLSAGVVVQSVVAGTGIGRAMAVAMTGQADSPALLVRIDLMFDTAGPL